MAVPCYLKIFNGFCFTSSDAAQCTFYSNPSYASFKQCSEDSNMGKTVRCADVDSDLRARFADSFKACVDKEVLQGATGGGGSGSSGSGGTAATTWVQAANTDVPGKDIAAAGGKSFTEVCGSLDQAKQQCAKTAGCAGFTWNGSCGFLKANVSDGKVGRPSWTLFALKQ